MQQASRCADHAHRERISLCSELERKNRLHQESYARSCQEIEELKRRCYEEENEVIQHKLDEYSTQHGREWRTVSLLRDQVGKLQQQLDFLKDEKEFHDPDSWSSSSRSHVPHPGGVFACQPVLGDKILTKYATIQEIWQHPRERTGEMELRQVRAENHCKQYLCLAFKEEQELKVVTVEIVQCL